MAVSVKDEVVGLRKALDRLLERMAARSGVLPGVMPLRRAARELGVKTAELEHAAAFGLITVGRGRKGEALISGKEVRRLMDAAASPPCPQPRKRALVP